ncbi:MAG: hypothetical protein NXH97_03600 [Rhodobacteraceae bacterium]|nr:hypothetical protein [Paracoccaceae bacterium]
MLVDGLKSRRHSRALENAVLGTLHVWEAPECEMRRDIRSDQRGDPTVVRGRLIDVAGAPLSGVRIDVWHACEVGFCDVQQ